jgi:hypothetical protein
LYPDFDKIRTSAHSDKENGEKKSVIIIMDFRFCTWIQKGCPSDVNQHVRESCDKKLGSPFEIIIRKNLPVKYMF